MFKNVNGIIRAYIYWDIVINSAWGLLGPVFAIFILQTVAVGNIAQGARVAGFAALCYWTTKAVIQLPIGNYLDKNHGEKDDFWFYVIGTIITGLVPFGFLFANVPCHIYALEVVHAVGMSMIIPASYAIFIRHVDKGREAYESSLDSTLLGVGVGITGALGGIMASYIGFKLIFVLAGLFTLSSVLVILPLRKSMLPRVPHNIHKIPVSKEFIE